MLPIPVPIIRTKRLIIPILYVFVTLALCHIFITAFTSSTGRNPSGYLVLEKGIRAPRSILKINISSENDSGGSNTTEIWVSHQDERMKPEGLVRSWAEDSECGNFTIQFAPKHTFKPRALVSFPGSGNTWLRHLIEASTGYFTGSIYNDKILFDGGFLGEERPPNDGSTILQKTHHFCTISSSKAKIQAYVKLSELMFGYRGILLIRNPYDALISFWNFKSTNSHVASRKESSFDTLGWKLFVQKGAKLWADLIQDWVEKSMDLIIVQYEDLKTNTQKELMRILTHLKQLVDPSRFRCTLKYKDGSFQRKQATGDKNSNKICPFKAITFGNLTLDLIVQNNIQRLNSFLMDYEFPLQLNYTAPDCN